MSARVSLVTGASSGIGRAVVHHLAARGDHLTLVARGRDDLERTAAEAAELGAASVTVTPCDVGDDDAVAACVLDTVGRHGRIDDVVCGAGVVAYGRMEEIPREVFEGVLRTNVLGVANVVRHVLPVMRSQNAGSIVILGSVVGHLGVPTMTPYVVSKWALRSLTRQLRLENRDVGIGISYVAPGGVDTPIYANGAYYQPHPGTPPPPVLQPDSVARVVVKRLEQPRRQTQVPVFNHVLRFGFSFAPRVYDLAIGPLLRRLAVDESRTVKPTSGTVFASREEAGER